MTGVRLILAEGHWALVSPSDMAEPLPAKHPGPWGREMRSAFQCQDALNLGKPVI
jgi:hypothetical protein